MSDDITGRMMLPMEIGNFLIEIEEHVTNLRKSGMLSNVTVYGALITSNVDPSGLKSANYPDELMSRQGTYGDICATRAIDLALNPLGISSAKELPMIIALYSFFKILEGISRLESLTEHCRRLVRGLRRTIMEELPSPRYNRHLVVASMYNIKVGFATMFRTSLHLLFGAEFP